MDLYLGNLPWKTTEEDITTLLSKFGSVTDISIPTDKATGRKRGFAFCKMENADQAVEAISSLNGKDFNGRNLIIREATPQPKKSY